MDPAASQINYQDVLSEFIHRQTVMLGPHITFAKLSHIKGLSIDPKGYVKKVDGDPQKLLEEVVAQFKPLSEFLVKRTLEAILSQHQSLTHFDQNVPAIKTHPINQIAAAAQSKPAVHPSINPLNPSGKPSTGKHRFGWFGKSNPQEKTGTEVKSQPSS